MYLKDKMQNREVTVCVTPRGVIDEILESFLVRPSRIQLAYNTFSDIVFDRCRHKDREGVYYVQDQASNLTNEFFAVKNDVSECLGLGEKLLSPNPIRNIWIGQSGSQSSLHFDFYENFHFLLSGEKQWTLMHPTDLPFLYLNYFPQAEWIYVTPQDDPLLTQPEWRIAASAEDIEDKHRFPWLEVNPNNVDETLFPRAANATSFHYVQKPGETLFVPATWHHQVTTTGLCPSIAVNYWHEPHNPNIETNCFMMAQFDRLLREKEHRR